MTNVSPLKYCLFLYCISTFPTHHYADEDIDNVSKSLRQQSLEDDANAQCSKVVGGNGCASTTISREIGKVNNKWENMVKAITEAENSYKKTKEDEIKTLLDGDCSLYSGQIEKDLKPFLGGITARQISDSISRGTLYQIVNGELLRSKVCKFPARCAGVEHFLKQIRKDIPNVEFVVNTSDWPQMSSHFPNTLPIFSFSKTQGYMDILYPAWTFWEGGPALSLYPTGIGRWDLMRKSLIASSNKTQWENKLPQVFFRGSRTSSERDALVLLSRKMSNLVNAKYTKNQAWKSDADTLNAPAATEVSLENHCKYKYLFNYRGVAASFRFKHLFLCKSLVFHVGHDWIEFFYSELRPWVHYIPVKPTANEAELKDIIQFANEHDDISNRIAQRGYDFVKQNLKMSHITCYWKALLLQYSTLLQYKIKKRDDVIALT